MLPGFLVSSGPRRDDFVGVVDTYLGRRLDKAVPLKSDDLTHCLVLVAPWHGKQGVGQPDRKSVRDFEWQEGRTHRLPALLIRTCGGKADCQPAGVGMFCCCVMMRLIRVLSMF